MYDPRQDGDERMMPGSDAKVPFSVRDVRQVILKRLWVVLLVVLVFLGATLGVTLWQTPVYEASAKLVVGQKPGGPQDSDLQNNTEGLQLILPSVVDAIDSPPVAEEVIQRLGLRMAPDTLLENLSVEQEGSTVFIQLSYKDADPERAQRIVNTVGVVSSERIPEAIGSAGDITVTMYEDALVPGSPASPDPVKNATLALILGLMVAPVLAIWMDERASRS